MADNISIAVEPRTAFGKKNKALRRTGKVPVHVYGLKADSLALQVEGHVLRATIREAGRTTPVTVNVKGGEDAVTLIREVRVHPVSGDLLHVDFMRVDVQMVVEAEVPITLINEEEAPGIRGGAGVVTQGTYNITVSARPFDIPHEIEVDCSVLVDLETDIKAGELKLPAGVELITDEDTRIAWIQPPRVAEEPIAGEAAEGEEGEEGEEGAEGEGGEESSEDEE